MSPAMRWPRTARRSSSGSTSACRNWRSWYRSAHSRSMCRRISSSGWRGRWSLSGDGESNPKPEHAMSPSANSSRRFGCGLQRPSADNPAGTGFRDTSELIEELLAAEKSPRANAVRFDRRHPRAAAALGGRNLRLPHGEPRHSPEHHGHQPRAAGNLAQAESGGKSKDPPEPGIGSLVRTGSRPSSTSRWVSCRSSAAYPMRRASFSIFSI